MKKERFTFLVAVHLILIEDNAVLLARRFNTGWKDGWYSVIAGHADGNETMTHAMLREAKEEGGIDITETDLKVAHTMHRITDSGAERIDFFLTAEKWSGEPQIMEKDKCDDIGWFPIDQLPENTIPYICSAIKNIQDNIAFSEFDERK